VFENGRFSPDIFWIRKTMVNDDKPIYFFGQTPK